MAFIDILEAAGNISEATFIKFLSHYKFHDKTIHCFFEGLDDQSFYVNYIELLYPNEYVFHYYICNGKDNIYSNYKFINWNTYSKCRTLFFTDKDLDDIIKIERVKDENIFVTKYYSIENYLVTKEVYARFLREICLITNEELIESLKNSFDEQLVVFSKHMEPVSAWIYYSRRNGYKLNLNEIDISKFVQLNPNFEIVKKKPLADQSRFEYICKVTNTSYFNISGVRDAFRLIKSINTPKLYIRGKYELWFLFAFCRNTVDVVVPELNKEIKKYNASHKVKITKCKATISFGVENIFQLVAPRTRLPSDVRHFLAVNLDKLINNEP